ncbi:MAG: peptidase T, partial [Clostridia bacterium]|nr:peptidase T [Clostridia bacterium]
DGTTLLGADDKAGIAEIVTLAEYLVEHPEMNHRPISICFTPDEEIGRGTERFDAERFGAKKGYTVDGGPLGELEYENFNAASAKITVRGLNIHPGSAKNKMKNAVLMAAEFAAAMPQAETPAHTEGYEGFYHLCELRGDENAAVMKYIIRDHDKEKFESRKKYITAMTEFMNQRFGNCFSCELRDSYYNMKNIIESVPEMIENAKTAFIAAGVEPMIVPIRGGTDGAMLSYKGIPCPNLSTGGENFHGVHEFISVQSMTKMVGVLYQLVRD